jgi:hypothetical protein
MLPSKIRLLFARMISMQPPIPPDARERIQPVLDDLEERLRPLLDHVPQAPDSAIQFRVPEEP